MSKTETKEKELTLEELSLQKTNLELSYQKLEFEFELLSQTKPKPSDYDNKVSVLDSKMTKIRHELNVTQLAIEGLSKRGNKWVPGYYPKDELYENNFKFGLKGKKGSPNKTVFKKKANYKKLHVSQRLVILWKDKPLPKSELDLFSEAQKKQYLEKRG